MGLIDHHFSSSSLLFSTLPVSPMPLLLRRVPHTRVWTHDLNDCRSFLLPQLLPTMPKSSPENCDFSHSFIKILANLCHPAVELHRGSTPQDKNFRSVPSTAGEFPSLATTEVLFFCRCTGRMGHFCPFVPILWISSSLSFS